MGDLRHSTEARVAEGHEGVTGKEEGGKIGNCSLGNRSVGLSCR